MRNGIFLEYKENPDGTDVVISFCSHVRVGAAVSLGVPSHTPVFVFSTRNDGPESDTPSPLSGHFPRHGCNIVNKSMQTLYRLRMCVHCVLTADALCPHYRRSAA